MASFNDGSGLNSGAVRQYQYTNYASVATGTTVIPWDNTIPQITEGTEFMTQAITPKSATNILRIEATLYLSFSTAESLSCALFQDSTANALAANSFNQATATGTAPQVLVFNMVAGTTSSTTFRIRAGSNGAGTITFNGAAGAAKFSTAPKSTIAITEYNV